MRQRAACSTQVREARLRRALLALIVACLDRFGIVRFSVVAQDCRAIQFWNITLDQGLSRWRRPGTDNWGPDQCETDRDGTVDQDERLRIREPTAASDAAIEAACAAGQRTGRPCTLRVNRQPIAIRLQASPTPWRRGWRSHPSRPATGSRRVQDAAPSIGTEPRPSDLAKCRTR